MRPPSLKDPSRDPCELRPSASIRIENHQPRNLWGAENHLPVRTCPTSANPMRLPASERENRRYYTTSRTVLNLPPRNDSRIQPLCSFGNPKSIVETTYFYGFFIKIRPSKRNPGTAHSTCRREAPPPAGKPAPRCPRPVATTSQRGTGKPDPPSKRRAQPSHLLANKSTYASN